MSLWILNNQNADTVVPAVRAICPDPALAIEIWTDGTNRGTGEVHFNPYPTASDVGTQLLVQLIISPVYVGIRGEVDDYAFSTKTWPDGTQPILVNVAGATTSDTFPNPNPKLVEVVFDAQNNSGNGFWVQDASGKHIPYPVDVSLFHELAHALEMVLTEG